MSKSTIQVSFIGGGYIGNIGNGFYEKGVKILLKDILKDNEYLHSMNMPEFSFQQTKLGYKGSRMVYKQKIDVLVVAGMIINSTWWVKVNNKCGRMRHGEMLKKVLEINPKCKILFLGVGVSGNNDYSSFFLYLKDIINKYPNCLCPVITRDEVAYSLFLKNGYNAYNGICCAGYLYYKQFPDLVDKNNFNIISDEELARDLKNKNSNLYNKNTIVLKHQDMDRRIEGEFLVRSLDEFLILLSNTSYLITNRVHGYIPALVFKRPVKFMLGDNQLMNDRRKGVISRFPIIKKGDFDYLDENKLIDILNDQKNLVNKIFENIRNDLS